jgi:hypothetical protein
VKLPSLNREEQEFRWLLRHPCQSVDGGSVLTFATLLHGSPAADGMRQADGLPMPMTIQDGLCRSRAWLTAVTIFRSSAIVSRTGLRMTLAYAVAAA